MRNIPSGLKPDLNPESCRFLEAAAAAVLCFERGLDMRGPLVNLSISYHEVLKEWPCDKCDAWTNRDSKICEKCEQSDSLSYVCCFCAVAQVSGAGERCPDCKDPEAA